MATLQQRVSAAADELSDLAMVARQVGQPEASDRLYEAIQTIDAIRWSTR